MQEIIFKIKSRFEEKLKEKTGWGRNEVQQILDDIIIDTLAEYIDSQYAKEL